MEKTEEMKKKQKRGGERRGHKCVMGKAHTFLGVTLRYSSTFDPAV